MQQLEIFFSQTFNLLVQYILLDPLKNGQIMYLNQFQRWSIFKFF